jgi:uncharacterized membrane protein
MDTATLLSTVPLFAGLSPDDLQVLSTKLGHRSCHAGEVVFSVGDVGNTMYFVESGQVSIHVPDESSRHIPLAYLARGEFFGELVLFGEQPRSATAIAITDAMLLELPHATLEQYLEERPHATLAILRTVSLRLRKTNALLSGRSSRNLNEEFDKSLSWGDRLADIVAELNGSWRFIFLLLAITLGWCAVNTSVLFQSPPDPYPYELFNLVLGILVSLQGPLIVMSQNRQSRKDRARADSDFSINLRNEVNIDSLLAQATDIRAGLNHNQSHIESILAEIRTMLADLQRGRKQ